MLNLRIKSLLAGDEKINSHCLYVGASCVAVSYHLTDVVVNRWRTVILAALSSWFMVAATSQYAESHPRRIVPKFAQSQTLRRSALGTVVRKCGLQRLGTVAMCSQHPVASILCRLLCLVRFSVSVPGRWMALHTFFPVVRGAGKRVGQGLLIRYPSQRGAMNTGLFRPGPDRHSSVPP